MSNVVPFPSSRRIAARAIPREEFEQLAELALEVVDRIVSILDDEDGTPDRKHGGDAEPSFGAPESQQGSRIVWLRGTYCGLEAE